VSAIYCDFGCSRKVNFKSFIGDKKVATDVYLSPEDLLRMKHIDLFAASMKIVYDLNVFIDAWSLGIVYA
jgi:serine/threonine protein kinase